MKPAILAVDDDPDVLRAVERGLRQIQPILAQDRFLAGNYVSWSPAAFLYYAVSSII